jgi:hypothetical protein
MDTNLKQISDFAIAGESIEVIPEDKAYQSAFISKNIYESWLKDSGKLSWPIHHRDSEGNILGTKYVRASFKEYWTEYRKDIILRDLSDYSRIKRVYFPLAYAESDEVENGYYDREDADDWCRDQEEFSQMDYD